MSFLVLHLDKFKKDAVRGIQSHNNRERESHSNPDIDYERSAGNYDLHEHAAPDYAGAVQNRIDDLLLVKAVRHDAVHMCGLIVSSDSEFFKNLAPQETKRFFKESKAFLTEFVGEKNVISAMVHMDEKTPHMHFLHVPVTSDGRLNANKIYTRESLKKLQTELPAYLQSRSFELQRGVEQVPGAKKKHLDTREFKQQQEAVNGLQREAATIGQQVQDMKREESAVQERLQSYEQQAQEAEKVLRDDSAIPEASMFSFKPALEKAQHIIEQQKKALASKHLLAAHNEKQQTEIQSLHEAVTALNKKVAHLETEKAEERERSGISIRNLSSTNQNLAARLEETEKFFRWNPSASLMRDEYEREQREEARRRVAEQKALEREQQEKRQREEQERKAQEQQKAQELERQQRERENSPARQWPSPSRGMGMGR